MKKKQTVGGKVTVKSRKSRGTAWRNCIWRLVTDRDVDDVITRYFGGHVSAVRLSEWVSGEKGLPRPWIGKFFIPLVEGGFVPSPEDWKRDIGCVVGDDTLALRAARAGISHPLIHYWRNGSRPEAWTIPYLYKTVLDMADPVKEDMRDGLRGAAEACTENPACSNRVRGMVAYYFGVGGREKHTMQETADYYGCTRQNVHRLFKRIGLTQLAERS